MLRIPATIRKNGILGSILQVSEVTLESFTFAETSISSKFTFRHPMIIMAMERVITIKDPHEIPAHFFWSSSIILNSIKYRGFLS
jgi:hypothetical protein